MLRRAEILSAYSEGQKVIVLTGDGRYSVQKKLYELEIELGDTDFIRISKSEIVNVRKIRSLDMSITGTIKLVLKTGYETYVSRRNVAKIKEKLTKVRSEDRA
jgi:DNA-binding LytR/AlgR family response regulator